MPPPAPTTGWGAVRQTIEAQAIGVMADDALTSAEQQLQFPAAPVWGQDGVTYTITHSAGAEGPWLDAWGRTLGVPRAAGETDRLYARRILNETLVPASNNAGMAQLLDDTLGSTGTRVEDMLTWAKTWRLNSRTRLGAPNKRLWGFNPHTTLEATFAVIFPEPSYAYLTTAEVERIISRRRAAGTRLLLLAMDGAATPPPTTPKKPLSRPFRVGARDARLNQGRPLEVLIPVAPHRRLNQKIRLNAGWRLDPIGGYLVQRFQAPRSVSIIGGPRGGAILGASDYTFNSTLGIVTLVVPIGDGGQLMTDGDLAYPIQGSTTAFRVDVNGQPETPPVNVAAAMTETVAFPPMTFVEPYQTGLQVVPGRIPEA